MAQTRLTDQAKEDLALAISSKARWVAVFTGDPGTTGANEASGGGYARVQATFTGGAADGSVPSDEVIVKVPAGTFPWIGLCTSASGAGTFYAAFEVAAPDTFASPGELKVAVTLVGAAVAVS